MTRLTLPLVLITIVFSACTQRVITVEKNCPTLSELYLQSDENLSSFLGKDDTIRYEIVDE